MDLRVTEKTVIVLDLDDTIYPEIDYLRSAYMEIARELDPVNWKSLFASMFSMFRSKVDVFGKLSETYPCDKSALLEQYRKHYPTISPSPGVMEFIESIKGNKGKLGIITDGRSVTQRNKIKALGLDDKVDMIVISEEIGTEKPDTANYRVIVDSYQNHSYCYIADNCRKDFIAPNQMGWATVGLVDSGLNMHFDTYCYTNRINQPKDYILNFGEINIIP